jgi:hypothetical protein
MFPVTLALGLCIVAAILLSPLYIQRVRLVKSSSPATVRRGSLGAALVLGSLGVAAVAVSLPGRSTPQNDALFLGLFVLLLVGSLLILAGDDTDEEGDGPDADPPWWPEFEAGFRQHLRHARRPISTR